MNDNTYIKKQYAIDIIMGEFPDAHYPSWYADLIRQIPSDDVAPVVHGFWINIPTYKAADGKYYKAQECSVCKAIYVSDPNKPYSNHPYCAECGAKMKEEQWKES